jgi:RNase P/RNase MRP subunit p29
MKKFLLFATLFLFVMALTNAKAERLEIPIVKNGESIEVELDDGTIITVDVSSDDAEQENEEMDSLEDDDLDFGWEGAPDDQNILTTGLRFQNITIPQGAMIEEAYIQVVSHEAKTADDVAVITIVGEASDNPQTYTLDALITDRTATDAKVVWTVAEDWDLWGTYKSADISSIVQELVNRPGWQSGNAMAFTLKGENQGPSDMENAREIESFENIADPEEGGDGKNHPERVPMLVIEYTQTSDVTTLEVPIVKNGESIEVELDDGTIITVDVSSDDAEQENEEMDSLEDDDLDFGWEGAPDDQNILTTGLRFQNITIPQGAMIEEAYIQVVSHEAKTADDVAVITIVGEASDNPQTYTLDALITDRPATDAKVVWTVAEDWDLWGTYKSADISSIVQELVNRPGWQSGNAMAFALKGENQGPSDMENAREIESFENIADPEEGGDGKNHPERVPKLIVKYSTTANVEDNFVDTSARIFPNPADDHIIVVLNNADKCEAAIYNQLGQLMSSSSFDSPFITIGIESLIPGMYYLKLNINDRIETHKVIVY